MEKELLVSVLMASYNRETFIKIAIQSILNQSYKNLELIILDDASTDASWKLIMELSESDPRIHAVRNQTNKGVGFTKKKLLDSAKGNIIFIVDADDAIADNAILTMVKEHLLNPSCSLIYSNHYICDADLNILNKKSISRKIPKGENHLTYHGIGHLVSIKKKYYDKIDGLDSSLKIAVDQDFYYQMEEVGDILFVDKGLYYYRQNEKSISLNKNKFIAAKNKVNIMRKARERRINKNLPLKLPSLEYLNLLDWWADNEFGRGNIIKSVITAVSTKRYDIIKKIFQYYLR